MAEAIFLENVERGIETFVEIHERLFKIHFLWTQLSLLKVIS